MTADDAKPAALSVVVPTIGRPAQLRRCLASILACSPLPSEIVVVDQSGGDAVGRLVAELDSCMVRRQPCSGRGVARAMNAGLRSAQHEAVLVTHDDCTVDPGWIAAAVDLRRRYGNAVVSGRVKGEGMVPSTKDDPRAHDFTGERHCGALYPNNMLLDRDATLRLGGFDERFLSAAEDNDFCYRWLREGGRLLYEPSLVVTHADWRTVQQLQALYRVYWRSQGAFYGKHLRRGDPAVLRFLGRDLFSVLRSLLGRVGKPSATDPRRGMLAPLLQGLLIGLRRFEPRSPRDEEPA